MLSVLQGPYLQMQGSDRGKSRPIFIQLLSLRVFITTAREKYTGALETHNSRVKLEVLLAKIFRLAFSFRVPYSLHGSH